MTTRNNTSPAQGARWVVGTILFVQGFGSALTEAAWGTSFGVAGLMRSAGAPGWSDYLLGALGVVLLLWALVLHRKVRTGAERA